MSGNREDNLSIRSWFVEDGTYQWSMVSFKETFGNCRTSEMLLYQLEYAAPGWANHALYTGTFCIIVHSLFVVYFSRLRLLILLLRSRFKSPMCTVTRLKTTRTTTLDHNKPLESSFRCDSMHAVNVGLVHQTGSFNLRVSYMVIVFIPSIISEAKDAHGNTDLSRTNHKG